jgi:rubredoxin
MPRSFDSDRPTGRLEFTENVECPVCGDLFEGFFYDYTESLSLQDMTEAPRGEHECPVCQFAFISEFSGWTFFTEAG